MWPHGDAPAGSSRSSFFNGRLGYRFDNGWRIQLDVLNLFNTKTNQINYAYGSLLTTDALFKQCFRFRSRQPLFARPA
jgi:TonB dependent receptor